MLAGGFARAWDRICFGSISMTDQPGDVGRSHARDAQRSESAPRVDLSAIDPRVEPAAFDAIVRSITADALAARAGTRASPTAMLGRRSLALLVPWTRPALAAAAVIAAIALPTLTLLHRPMPAPAVRLVESAGIPASIAD